MVFSSLVFLFIFLPVVIVCYYLLHKRYRNFFLLLASLFFYAWGEPHLILVMLVSIAINYLSGLMIDQAKTRNKSLAKLVLGVAVMINLSMLIYFKYFNFILQNVQHGGWFLNMPNVPIILPIGISFFTFHSISYLVDIYRNDAQVQRNPFNLGLYISLFPQLVAGPILRYHDIAPQIEKRGFNSTQFLEGALRFIRGLAKKVLIANTCALIADKTFDLPVAEIPMLIAWLGITCYTLQIYFDFSGYSDMAIGLGKMFGFDFLENFNYPYISKSIQEFWRRWHISLSTWFRDYLYIPLGGSKHGSFVTYRNLLIVFFVTGLWHGASWNFILWGLLHGLFLVLERLGFNRLLSKAPAVVGHVYTLSVVVIGWVLFRAPDLTYAIGYLQSMFGLTAGTDYSPIIYFNNYVLIVLVVGVLFATPLRTYLHDASLKLIGNRKIPSILYQQFGGVVAIMLLLFCFVELAQNSYNPFIYFRF
jgi:alginate O-acetyltransferase complex protein AlgI